MKWKKYMLLLALFFSIILNGCSIIGYTIGGKLKDDRVFIANDKEITLLDSTATIIVNTANDRIITGGLIDYSKITNNQYNDELPLASNLNIRTRLHGGLYFDYSIPIEDIEEIKIKDGNLYKMLGFVAGASIDTIVFFKIIYELRHMPKFHGRL